ncbi:MAG: signal peptidase I [Pseudomonadota bacterium]
MLNSFKAKHYEIYDFIRSAFYALFLAMFIRSLIIQPFNIPSESMVPSLLVGDYIFVDKSAYGYSKYSFPFAPDLFEGRIFSTMPERGDVAVFRVVDDQNKDYIKRIVGLPGDKIQYIDGRLWVNGAQVPVKMLGPYDGRPLDPSAYNAPVFEETLDGKTYQTLDIYDGLPTDNTPIFEVPEGHFFVTGDNRDKSQDSRLMNGPVGFVPMDRLIGKAEIIFFSLDRENFLEVWKWPTAIRFNRIFKNID